MRFRVIYAKVTKYSNTDEKYVGSSELDDITGAEYSFIQDFVDDIAYCIDHDISIKDFRYWYNGAITAAYSDEEYDYVLYCSITVIDEHSLTEDEAKELGFRIG